MRLLLLFLFQIYSLSTTFQSNFSSRPYSYENKPKPLHVENRHVRLTTVDEEADMTNYLKEAKMIYERVVNIGESNFVFVTIDPPLIGAIIYMSITDTCKEDDRYLLCIRTKESDLGHEEDFVKSVDVISSITLTDFENGTYGGSYTIRATALGFITISVYIESEGLRGLCYNNILFEGPPAGERLDFTLDHDWEAEEEICHGLTDYPSIRWIGKLTTHFSGDHCFHIEAYSDARLYVNGEEILESVRGKDEATIPLDAGKHDVVLDYNGGYEESKIHFYWAESSCDPPLRLVENFVHVSSIKSSKNVEVTCKPGYYLDEANKRCERCPKGTYKNSGGLQECTPCPVGTYNNHVKSISIIDCSPCRKGTYNDNIGQADCKLCPKGTYNNKFGQVSISSCLPCPVMTYNDGEGAVQCNNCLLGTYSNIMRASHCSDCDPLCQACFGPSKDECSSCIESSGAEKLGTTTCDCPENSYYSSSDNRCIPCHPFCLGCFDSHDKCKKCDTRISYSVIDKINYCVHYCEDGYYEDDTVCKRIFYSIIL